ncbi:MAG: hypothetical protein AAF589_08890, partial [Planctomycetota bacterium]
MPSGAVAPNLAPAKPPLKPAGPDTTIWIDDRGVPRPVVGMSYEELARAWRLLQDLEQRDETPRFVRESLAVDGRVDGDRVQLDLKCKVFLPAGGRVAVPLGFGGAVLAAPARIDGDQASGQFVAYDATKGGYVAWLAGEAGVRHVVAMSLVTMLQRDGTQTLLRCNVPRASQSEFKIAAPKTILEPFASPGAVLDARSTDDESVRLRARGAVGDFQLGWREPVKATPRQQRTVLSVEGQILAEIDGRSVRSTASLLINSYGGEVERFRIRLPRGATLIPPPLASTTDQQPRLTPIAEGDPELESPQWLVTLPAPTSSPVTVELVCEQAVGLDEEQEIDLAGFEVLGAVRQYGDMAIRVAEDWRLRWGESQMARRIDISELPEEMQRPGLTDAVRYYRQPWKQDVRVSLLRNRVEATPSYRLELRPDEAILRTTIDYRIPGARVSSFTVDLRDFPLLAPDPIEPVRLVDNEHAAACNRKPHQACVRHKAHCLRPNGWHVDPHLLTRFRHLYKHAGSLALKPTSTPLAQIATATEQLVRAFG